jgi:hypothetical protein
VYRLLKHLGNNYFTYRLPVMTTNNDLLLNVKRFRILLFISLLLCFVPDAGLKAQSNSTVGYIDKGDSVEFVFGQQRTINIGTMQILLEKRINEINQVNVAGDFNGWNPNSAKYQMRKAGGTLFKITLVKASLGKPGELRQFKFVLNHEHWVEPPAQATNKFTGKDGNTNLTLKL